MVICAYVTISILYLNHWIFLQHSTQLTMVSYYNKWNTHTYGISGNLYHWFNSYLYNRQLKVCINSSFSKSHNQCGVHQGSVLGARLYTVYARPVSTIQESHNISYLNYADDTQLCIQCDHNEVSVHCAIFHLEHCISTICEWMKQYALNSANLESK